MAMSFKQIDRVRCEDCGTEAEIPSSMAPPQGDLTWCCRACGAPLTSLDTDRDADEKWAEGSSFAKTEVH
jgi:hypothetical protein